MWLREAKSSSWIYKEICIMCVCLCFTNFNMSVKLYIPLYVSLRVFLNESKLVGEITLKVIGNLTSNKCIYFVFDENKYYSKVHRM